MDPASANAVLDTATFASKDGAEYVLWADVGDVGGGQMAPVINGGPISAGGPTCSAFTFADLP